MNKIVFEHYPVSKLPDDLRQEFDASATVKIVIEEQPVERKWPGFPPEKPRQPPSGDELGEMIQRLRASDRPSVTPEEAVRRIRELRDEWDY